MKARLALAGLAGSLALLGATAGTALAAPACSGGGCNGSSTVPDSLTVGETFSFTMNTTSVAFTGPIGGASNVATVNYTVATNSAVGGNVMVTGSDLTGPGGTVPAGDISLWGTNQEASGFSNPAPVGAYQPIPLTTSSITTTSFGPSDPNSPSPSGGTFTDSYAFLGTAGGYQGPGSVAVGANIPNVAPGWYNGQLAYLAIASG